MEMSGAFSAIIMLCVVVVSGCLGVSPLDCGSDESCFADAVAACAPATVRTGLKEDTFGVTNVRYVISASVEGKEEDYCIVKETFEEIEMVGNLTQAPSELIFYLYSLTGSTITCEVSGPVSLDIEGIDRIADRCSGDGIDALREALRYKEGEPPVQAKRIEVREAYCVGGKKIVSYVRNAGTEGINLSTDLQLVDAGSGESITVEWKDFSGFQVIEVLYPLKIAQFSIGNLQPGALYSYQILLGQDSYTFSAQC